MITIKAQIAQALSAISTKELEELVRLQEMDNTIAKIQSELSNLPEKMAAIESSLNESVSAVEGKKAERDAVLSVYRKHEADLDANQAKIAKRDAQLSEVTTNREYQLILGEINELKEKNSRIEDESLKCLEEVDRLNEVIGELEAACRRVKDEVEAEKSELKRHGDMLRKKLKETEKDVKKLRAGLDENLLAQYDSIRKRAAGLAVVEVRDAVCQGCHLNIPPQMYNQLHQKEAALICPHCYRLIYVASRL